jgi:hypothetical protein
LFCGLIIDTNIPWTAASAGFKKTSLSSAFSGKSGERKALFLCPGEIVFS